MAGGLQPATRREHGAMATAASQASPTITTRDGTVIASHGLTATHKDQFNADLLEFSRA
jgi:hypothetical protein